MASNDFLSRDLFILSDEDNPLGSKSQKVAGSTILDQVFDDQDPAMKNLREIIEELKVAIATGGHYVINFPVTSVNGKMGDVTISKTDVGLGDVDNTKDMDKPLSDVQRETIMGILENYEFDVDLSLLHQHLRDYNNPHHVTTDQLNRDGSITELITRQIGSHNVNNMAHEDIRNSITSLSNRINNAVSTMSQQNEVLSRNLVDHTTDSNAHADIMERKEDSFRKTPIIDDTTINYDNYPSTRAVVEYVLGVIEAFREELGDLSSIKDIIVIADSSMLPESNASSFNKAYFIVNGQNGTMEVSICRKNGGDYYWDTIDTGTYTNLDPDYFYYNASSGLQVKPEALGLEMLKNEAVLAKLVEVINNMGELTGVKFTIEDGDLWIEVEDELGIPNLEITDNGNLMMTESGNPVDDILKLCELYIDRDFLIYSSNWNSQVTFDDVYTKTQIDNMGFIRSLHIVRGTTNGTIRFYVNDNLDTMSEDIPVAGLKRLAYMETVTDKEIADGSIMSNHISDNAIQNQHMGDKSVDASNLTADYKSVFANLSDTENRTVQEVPLDRFVEAMAPAIKDILEGSDLVQMTEEAVRYICKSEIRKAMRQDWDFPDMNANFTIDENGLLCMEYDDDAGDPTVLIDEDTGELVLMEDTEIGRSRIERDLEKFQFSIRDYNLTETVLY